MNLYSVVMLDMDGTLPDSGRRVSPNTTKLLRRLNQRGIPVILCSSRQPGGMEAAARQFGLHSPAVCYGGSLILDADRNLIRDTGIDSGTALRFREFAAGEFPDISVTSYLYDIWLADSVMDPNVRGYMEQHGCEAVVGSLADVAPSHSHVHKLMCLSQPLRLKTLQDRAVPLFPTLSFSVSGTACLEITAAEATTYTAMEAIRSYYHITAEQIVAVGACAVDVEMLRHAGLGIAMGNAPECVREAAARVTASNDEDGVYIALKNLRFCPPC